MYDGCKKKRNYNSSYCDKHITCQLEINLAVELLLSLKHLSNDF